MKPELLIYIGAALPLFWGIAHLFPTKSVVRGFGDISADNRNIITMEWIIEGIAMIFIGVILAGVTVMGPASNISMAVYIISSACLIVLAVVSLKTGFKVNFLPFKLCPVIFTVSAALVMTGRLLL